VSELLARELVQPFVSITALEAFTRWRVRQTYTFYLLTYLFACFKNLSHFFLRLHHWLKNTTSISIISNKY